VPVKKISYTELLQILELIKITRPFSKLHIKFGDIEIDLSRDAEAPTAHPQATLPLQPASAPIAPTVGPAPAPPATEQRVPPQSDAIVARDLNARQRETMQPRSANAVLVRSPMVGTFYRAPAPGAPPFVEIGHAVGPDTTVCIIEVMKLMNSILAGVHGTVTHILADNAQLVEHGQIIMVIEPR
jgi:acetyl-CoA carboxylase biotin carboxyl carrier protein